MQHDDTPQPEQPMPESVVTPEEPASPPEGDVAAAEAAEDTFLVQSLTLFAFAILSLSYLSGFQLFG